MSKRDPDRQERVADRQDGSLQRRLEYSSPQLQRYGTLVELTRTAGQPPADDLTMFGSEGQT